MMDLSLLKAEEGGVPNFSLDEGNSSCERDWERTPGSTGHAKAELSFYAARVITTYRFLN
jgi:hypothetical protein